jgi:hypothetical protein
VSERERERDVVMMRCEMRDRILASPCVKRGIRGRETGRWSGGEDEEEEEEEEEELLCDQRRRRRRRNHFRKSTSYPGRCETKLLIQCSQFCEDHGFLPEPPANWPRKNKNYNPPC